MARGRRRRLGAHVIEFALTLPAFVVIMAATFDMGWLFFQQAMLDNAMHEGCRAGAVVDPAAAVPEEVAEEEILSILSAAGQACNAPGSVGTGDTDGGFGIGAPGSCDFTFERTGARPAISMNCKIVRKYTPLFGLVPAPEFIGSQTLMRFEWQDLVE